MNSLRLRGCRGLTLVIDFIFKFTINSLSLVLRLLLVFLTILLRLHDVVHQIIDILIIHLLFGVIEFCLLRLVFARLLALVICSFLLSHSTRRIKVILATVLGEAATIALVATLHFPLMILELNAIVEDLFACYSSRISLTRLLSAFSI